MSTEIQRFKENNQNSLESISFYDKNEKITRYKIINYKT